MHTLWQDLRYGARMLLKQPAFTLVAVLTLTIGIGANTAIFSIVDGIYLRPWPVKDPNQLARVVSFTPQGQTSYSSYADYLDLRRQSRTLSGILAYSRQARFLKLGGESELTLVDVVSQNYFSVLGVNAAVGRTFSLEEEQNTAAEPTAVISYELWQRRFGGAADLIGKPIQLNGRFVTLIGIAPPSFRGLQRGVPTHIWLPVKDWSRSEDLQGRDSRSYELIARLQSGATPSQASAELETISRNLAEAYPTTNKDRKFTTISESERIRETLPTALFLLAIVGLVLLIACANVAGLLLARAEKRRREIAIRLALGSGRRRLISQLLTESLLLALVGAALGLLLAAWLIGFQSAVLPPSSPLNFDLRIDGRVFAFTVLATTLAALLFGLVPALQASRVNLVSTLKGEEVGQQGGDNLFSPRNLLVIGQIALSVLMLSAAGLLLRSFLFSQQIRPGFDANKNLVILNLLPSGGSQERLRTIYPAFAERVQNLPGVKQATYARRALLTGSGGGAAQRVTLPGVDLPTGQQSVVIKFNSVGTNYFRTMGTRILQGRDFNQSDVATAPRVVLVNETLARRYWPNGDCLTRILQIGKNDYQIIGVVEDAKIIGIHEEPEPYLYLTFAQVPAGEAALIVETVGDPQNLVEAIRQQIRAEDPNVAFLNVTTLRQLMRYALWDDRIAAGLVGLLSMLGMFLAAVGLYATISYAVNRRTHEIGIRMALGAQRGEVLKLVLAQGLGLALVGVPVGLAVAMGVTRFIASRLYGVKPTDPLTFAASAVLIVAVAALASYFPARRATKVDPMVALRCE